MLSIKPTTSATFKAKRYRNWILDIDRYDSNTNNTDVSE